MIHTLYSIQTKETPAVGVGGGVQGIVALFPFGASLQILSANMFIILGVLSL